MNRSCVGYRRSRPRHHDTVRLGRDGHRQQLVLRLLANTEGSLAILVSPLEHLVCIYSMLTGHSGNRSSRNKRRFYDATLLLPCSSLPLMRRGRFLNCFRIAHKVSVRQKNPDVYTAKSGRLPCRKGPTGGTGPSVNAGCPTSRSCFARCGIPRILTILSRTPKTSRLRAVESHSRENERGMGHSGFKVQVQHFRKRR